MRQWLDVKIALMLVVLFVFFAWFANALSNFYAGLLIGLVIFCLIRLVCKKY